MMALWGHSCHLQTPSAPSQGAMSVDSITDLSDNASELLEALQLSHPHELDPRRSRGKKKPLSLNPISWQVPRIVDRCCTHLETHGKGWKSSRCGHWDILAWPPPGWEEAPALVGIVGVTRRLGSMVLEVFQP